MHEHIYLRQDMVEHRYDVVRLNDTGSDLNTLWVGILT